MICTSAPLSVTTLEKSHTYFVAKYQFSSPFFGFSLFRVITARQHFPFDPIDFISFPPPTLFISTISLAFLFSFYLAPPSPSSFFPCSLLSFSRIHTSVALHPEVFLPALRFWRSLSRIRFLSCHSQCPSHHFQFSNFHFLTCPSVIAIVFIP